jgi:hypothetical protein
LAERSDVGIATEVDDSIDVLQIREVGGEEALDLAGVTCDSDPSSVMTRDKTMTVRNGSSGPLTRGSRSGSISSRAVANRIVPRRCSVPSLSTNPLGSVKLNSVCKPAMSD